MGDLRPDAAAAFDVLGVPATITPVNGTPVATAVIWISPLTAASPSGGPLTRRDPTKTAAVLISDVPALPRGSAIQAPELEGGPVLGWRVEEFESGDVDQYRVIVVRDSSLDP